MGVLDSLNRLYETLVEREDLSAYTWSPLRVAYAVDLDSKGALRSVMPLVRSEFNEKTKKSKEVIPFISVPLPYKRSSGVKANFLCDNSSYLLGIDKKGNEKRTQACFAAAKQLHKKILQSCEGLEAQAVIRFFDTWQPDGAKQHPELSPYYDAVQEGVNLTFAYEGRLLNKNKEIRKAWQRYFSKESATEAEEGQCLVTGEWGPLARLHPNIKGVLGAQSSGASLVSYNAPAYESYGQVQGNNGPVSIDAALAYGAALNYLLSHKDKMVLGDTSLVFWAESAEEQYTDWASIGCSPTEDNIKTLDLLRGVTKAISKGDPIDVEGKTLDPKEPFYMLGLAPNAARLSVRFFLESEFGSFLKNLLEHHERTLIDRDEQDRYRYMPLWLILRETENRSARTPKPRPNLFAELAGAIWANQKYPRSLLNDVERRIYAEKGAVNANRAAIIKAYLLKNLPNNHQAQEVLTMKLSAESNYTPYVLGRLFALLEKTQKDSVYHPSTLNTSIKERYFASACTTPSSVFPYLLKLSQNHQRKLSDAARVNVEKLLQDLLGRMETPFPTHLSLEEQGVMQIGYYHQMRDFWNAINSKKAEKKEYKDVGTN